MSHSHLAHSHLGALSPGALSPWRTLTLAHSHLAHSHLGALSPWRTLTLEPSPLAHHRPAPCPCIRSLEMRDLEPAPVVLQVLEREPPLAALRIVLGAEEAGRLGELLGLEGRLGLPLDQELHVTLLV